MADEYKKLDVWKVAMQLAKEVYLAVRDFPADEKFGLTLQIKKSAVSVPSNIAEGSARRANKDFVRFVNIASGSLAELETQLLLSKDLGFVKPEELEKLSGLIIRVDQMLIRLRKSLENVELKITVNDKRSTVNA